MDPLETKAREIYAVVGPAHEMEAPAPGTHPFLDFLMEMLKTFGPMLITCMPKAQRTDATVFTSAIKNPSLRQRAGMRFWLMRNIDDPRTGNATVGDIMGATLATFAATTDDQGKQMHAMCL